MIDVSEDRSGMVDERVSDTDKMGFKKHFTQTSNFSIFTNSTLREYPK